MHSRSESESPRRWSLWLPLAVIALWWPSRVTSILDGIPLTSIPEGIVLGLLLPALCCLAPWFFAKRAARIAIVALLLWKALTTAALAQDGWCVRMVPARPYVADSTGAPHSWDVRADWRSPDPTCSAVMTRGYKSNEQFPVWFFNLSPSLIELPAAEDLPPLAKTVMTVTGTLHTAREQVLRIATNDVLKPEVLLDGTLVPASGMTVPPGPHSIRIETLLTGEQWQFEPLLNDAPVWSAAVATMATPSRVDVFLRPWAAWIIDLVVGSTMLAWLIAYARVVLNLQMAIWIACAGVALALCPHYVPLRYWHFVVSGLAVVCLVRITPAMRTTTGAFLLIGVPWLALVASAHADQFGRMTFYSPGDDWWSFQRFAYRIYLQGYWLEGGEPTFWFQPLYRWIAGALHVVFGDSSVGEAFWDGGCLAFMSMFAFAVVNAVGNVRWALLAAVLTLTSFVAGPGFMFVGRGLSEISSAGFLYLAALFAMRGHGRSIPARFPAGVCATLGMWTRLNNLPMAIGVAAFAWPLSVTTRALRQPARLFKPMSWPTIATVFGFLALGLLLFALRTWHYTGRLSVFGGTQIDPRVRGVTRQVWNGREPLLANLSAVFDSVMMVLTTTDPPHLHTGAMPVLAGAAIAVVALAGPGPLGRLPLAPVLFCLSSIAGAVVARGTAYAGRFSIHVIGITVAVLVCALSILHACYDRKLHGNRTAHSAS